MVFKVVFGHSGTSGRSTARSQSERREALRVYNKIRQADVGKKVYHFFATALQNFPKPWLQFLKPGLSPNKPTNPSHICVYTNQRDVNCH